MFVSSFSEIIDCIGTPDDCGAVVVGGHVNPDGDCTGSVLALTLALKAKGFDASPVLADEGPADGMFSFLPGFDLFRPASELSEAPELFIAVDVSRRDRLGQGEALCIAAERRIVIDHHPDADDFGDVTYVDGDSAAAGIIIWELIEDMGVRRDREMATCCLCALITDTGCFQYQNTTPRAFRIAAEMAQEGARPDVIAREVYQNKSMASLKLEEFMLGRMKFACDGRIVYSWITREEIESLGAAKDDMEELIDVLRALRGIEVAALMKVGADGIRVSLRAKGDADVSSVAHALGGGGHRAAAGCTMHGELEEARDELVDLLEGLLA